MIRAWCRYLLLLAVAILVYLLLGGYLFLLILLNVTMLPCFSLFALLFQHHKIQLDFQRKAEGNCFCCRCGRLFPMAELRVRIQMENIFLQQYQEKDIHLLTGASLLCYPLMKHENTIGRISLSYEGYELRDLLGLFRIRSQEHRRRTYYLFPHEQAVPSIALLSDQLNDQEHIWEGHIQAGGILEDKHEVKEYQPGDDLRHIHHKLSYKWRKTMIREFASFQQEQVLVYLDLHGSIQDCESVLSQFYACAQEWIAKEISAIVCWSSMDGNFEEEVASQQDLKRCLQVVLSHPKSEEEDNVLYRSQLGTHLCIRAQGIDIQSEKGSAEHV